jgi:aryl-alcohol dehydrogenase-like predicted oxidoreductase
VTSVLTAVSTVEQLEDGLGAIERSEFGDDELQRIDAILAGEPEPA